MKYLNDMLVRDDDWLQLAIASSKDDVEDLAAEACGLVTRYGHYDVCIASHADAPDPSRFARVRALLVDFYENPPSALNAELKARRNDHGLAECPSCGSPFIPDTLDHFMPKEDWPEFSIYPNNLIPQCRGCAPIKGRRYYCATRKTAMFLHPMYSDLLSNIGFRINVTLSDHGPDFAIGFVKLAAIDSALETRLSTHFEELKIRSRIACFCHREYVRWKNKIAAKKFDVKLAFQLRVGEQPDDAPTTGRDWRTAFFKGMLRNPAIISHLESLAPRKPAPQIVEFGELNC
ncbi:HNH endonuclease [Burkholderia cenocepacia]|nr:HNH endonuclease [Burkholderia cenocepacia]RQV89749.1 HNH endonuclease [Burkholderia cenocepacia]